MIIAANKEVAYEDLVTQFGRVHTFLVNANHLPYEILMYFIEQVTQDVFSMHPCYATL